MGHLEAAAGVTGLINAVQALIHRQLPPAVGFEAANPNIDLANSPFYFNTRLCPWKESAAPRRAGVSSFGVGGTNAHVVIEEAPPEALASRRRDGQVLVLSARSAEALEQVTDRLAAHLKAHPDADLGSVAFTLQAGRRAFEYRRAVACADMADAVRVLENRTAGRVLSHVHNSRDASVVFMFPGQGSQYLNMGADPYRSDAPFRADVDWCCDVLAQHLHLDLRTALFADERAPHDLTETWLSQPALFVIEYALARLWMRWGVRPRAMIGHSVGEFVAACLAGVFSPEDALAMVATRARLMQELPSGAMLSVRMGEDEAATLLNGELSLAAANGPRLSVVAGPVAAIAAFERKMAECGVPSRRLATSHAFHSRMMDPVIGPFTDYLRRFRFHAPKTPYVSGVSGAWVPAEEATDPGYWARHLREPVRFSKGVRLLQTLPAPFFLEVGPGHVLCTLARQHSEVPGESVAVASLPAASDGPPGRLALLNAAGALWLHGATPNWAETHGPRPRRCPLPTYPFERKRYWIDPPARGAASEERQTDDGATPAGAPRAQSKSEAVMPEPSPSDAGTPPRKVLLRTALIELFQELSGLTVAECDASATFLEMGFDSLFLTQVTQALQTKFGLRIAFRQLLDQESTVNALAAYLDARLPADQFRAAPAAPAVPPAVAAPAVGAAAIVAGPTAIETVVREQLQAMSQLMTRQLEILRGAGVAAPPAPGAAALAPKQEFKAYGRYKPVQRGPVGGLTERQARHLSELVRRYTAKTAQSKEMTQRRRPMLADPRVASGFRAQWKEMVYPVVTVRSQGSRLWDLDGNDYIDLLNGFGPIFFGHSPSFITEAITAQLKDGYETGPQTALAGEVAELVCELTGSERVTFCNTGSEAVMAAMRVARTVTGRKKVVMFTGDYHGTFDEVLVKGVRRESGPTSTPIAPGVPEEMAANILVLDYGTPESLETIRQHARDLAAVLVEPVQSRHPALQPVEFLREVRKITEASETALIFDEIVTGFRAHPGGVQALFGIRADLAAYGKVVGGGMPIGVLAGAPASWTRWTAACGNTATSPIPRPG